MTDLNEFAEMLEGEMRGCDGKDPNESHSIVCSHVYWLSLAKAIRSLRPEEAAWVLCAERMPPDNEPVMIFGSKHLRWAVARHTDQDEWLVETCSDVINIYPPKYWRPLPERPLPQSDTSKGDENVG